MKKGTILYGTVCFALGAALCGGGAAYAAGVMAERSTNTIYVDGEQVELEAYLINGSNYVKLRDMEQAVGFNVYWNEEERSVQIESDRPYTREAYNALRASIVNGSSSSPVPMSQETRDVMREMVTEFGEWPVYRLKANGDGQLYFTPDYPDGYKGAAEYCRPFIDALAGLDDTEKIRQIAFYVCDRLTYKSSTSSSVGNTLTSDGVKAGNCMTYAHNFTFLCSMAGIPCVYVQSQTHQWNEVYANGKWWSVDVSAVDVGNDPSLRPYQAVLYDPSEMQGESYGITQPELVRFVKEVLIPGSTK